MGFGLSGSPIGIQMQGADPTLVWVDGLTGPQAVDYHLSAYHKVSNAIIFQKCWICPHNNLFASLNNLSAVQTLYNYYNFHCTV